MNDRMPAGFTRNEPVAWNSRYAPPVAKSVSSRWPANMLANNRRDSVIGRMIKLDRNSSGTRSGKIQAGTPGGTVCSFRYREEPMPGDADTVVDDPHHAGESVGEARAGERGELQERDEPEQVVDENEEEHRRQQRHEAHVVAAADDVLGNAVANEAVGLFREVLRLRRNDPQPAGCDQEEGRHDDRAQHEQQRTLREQHLIAVEDVGKLEIGRTRSLETVASRDPDHAIKADVRHAISPRSSSIGRGALSLSVVLSLPLLSFVESS